MDSEVRAGPLAKSHSATRVAAVGVGMYLVAALLMALNGAFIKMAIQAGLTPGRVTELRNAGALVLLFCYVLLSNRSALRLRPGEWRFLAVYGVVAFALVQFLYFVTISRLPIGIGTMLAFLAPVVVALWTRFGRKQSVSAQLKVAIGLALAGLFLVSQVWSGFAFDLVGVAAGLLLAVALAAFWILGESGQQHRDPVSLTMWGFAWATLVWSVALPWWSFPWDVLGRVADPIGVGLPNLPVWAIMAGGIAFGTVVPFLLVLGSLRRIGAQRAGIVGTTEPLWAFLLGFIILGEVVAPIQILGVGLVLAGVLVAELSRNPGPAPGVERTDHRRRVPDSLATGAQSVPPRP